MARDGSVVERGNVDAFRTTCEPKSVLRPARRPSRAKDPWRTRGRFFGSAFGFRHLRTKARHPLASKQHSQHVRLRNAVDFGERFQHAHLILRHPKADSVVPGPRGHVLRFISYAVRGASRPRKRTDSRTNQPWPTEILMNNRGSRRKLDRESGRSSARLAPLICGTARLRPEAPVPSVVRVPAGTSGADLTHACYD